MPIWFDMTPLVRNGNDLDFDGRRILSPVNGVRGSARKFTSSHKFRRLRGHSFTAIRSSSSGLLSRLVSTATLESRQGSLCSLCEGLWQRIGIEPANGDTLLRFTYHRHTTRQRACVHHSDPLLALL